jgi:hypothetical protein
VAANGTGWYSGAPPESESRISNKQRARILSWLVLLSQLLLHQCKDLFIMPGKLPEFCSIIA